MNGNPGRFAEELVVSCFVGILKPSPSADVVDKNRIVAGTPAHHVLKQLAKAVPMPENDTALCLVCVGLSHREPVSVGVDADRKLLVMERILLVFRRHPKVLSSGD